jgi:hypothetical protein
MANGFTNPTYKLINWLTLGLQGFLKLMSDRSFEPPSREAREENQKTLRT